MGRWVFRRVDIVVNIISGYHHYYVEVLLSTTYVGTILVSTYLRSKLLST